MEGLLALPWIIIGMMVYVIIKVIQDFFDN